MCEKEPCAQPPPPRLWFFHVVSRESASLRVSGCLLLRLLEGKNKQHQNALRLKGEEKPLGVQLVSYQMRFEIKEVQLKLCCLYPVCSDRQTLLQKARGRSCSQESTFWKAKRSCGHRQSGKSRRTDPKTNPKTAWPKPQNSPFGRRVAQTVRSRSLWVSFARQRTF